jgi:predicted DNA binding CopG/RHH family protein
MEVNRMKTKLDSFEQDIEDHANEFRPVSTQKRELLESLLDDARKTKNINIRISEYDLEKLHEKSASEGLPYQTLISSIIHKYVSNQLINENDILKSIQLLQSNQS